MACVSAIPPRTEYSQRLRTGSTQPTSAHFSRRRSVLDYFLRAGRPERTAEWQAICHSVEIGAAWRTRPEWGKPERPLREENSDQDPDWPSKSVGVFFDPRPRPERRRPMPEWLGPALCLDSPSQRGHPDLKIIGPARRRLHCGGLGSPYRRRARPAGAKSRTPVAQISFPGQRRR
jgi:hypothetical protein